jgi:hypothetical protein
MTRTLIAVPLALAVATTALTALTASPALAQGGDDTRARGTCSKGSTWQLKAGPENGRLEVELEVDSNRVGQTWSWSLTDNGTAVASGTARTVAPSGSFEVRRLVADRAGTDALRARATNAATGEVCLAAVNR